MFVRCKRRFKDGKEHRYWSVVENVRVRGGRRVVQRHILYLGEINDNQRAAWCRSIEVVEGKSGPRQMALFPNDRDAPALDCEVVRINVSEVSLHDPRQWGACWLALNLWGRLDLDRFWGERLPPSRQGTRWLDILKILACYRLIDPGSEWRLHRHWYEHSALRDLLGSDRAIADDTLYRCLDKLLEHKQDFFSFLRARWATLFDARFDVLLYDLTSTYFESDPPFDDKRRFGYSRDKRPDCVQVVIALIVTPEGFPLAYEVMPGNTADDTTLAAFLKKIEDQYGRSDRIWIMDRGIPTEETLASMREGDAPVRYLVGTPKGRLTRREKAVPGPALARGAPVRERQAAGRRRRTLRPGAQRGAATEGARHASAPAEEALASAGRAAKAVEQPGPADAQARRRQEGGGPGLEPGPTSACPGATKNSPPMASHSACGATGCAGYAVARAVICCDPTWSPKTGPRYGACIFN